MAMALETGEPAVVRQRLPLQRAGVCLFLVTLLFGVSALGGHYMGQLAEKGPSIDGSYAMDGTASNQWARFEIHGSIVALAMVMALSLSNLAYGAWSKSSSSGVSRKCAALLIICCVLGCELPSAEALSRPVIDGEGVFSMHSYVLNGHKDSGASSLLSNDSVSGMNTEEASSHAHRSLLSVEDAVPLQIPTELLEMNGFTDADMSPTLPEAFMKEEDNVDNMNNLMDQELKKSKKKEEAMETRVNKLDEMINDQLGDVATSVQQENERLTNEIVEVPPVPGPPGPEGEPGKPGKNGANGIHGKPGLQGPTGMQGIHGVRGPIGVEGNTGPYGPAGVPGMPGVGGDKGSIGPLGPAGLQGLGSEWKGSDYFCPEANSATMKLEQCSTKGCLLETKFENTWGTVCSDGFTHQNAYTLCMALGFPDGGAAVLNIGGGKADAPIWLNNVDCKGGEGDVADCGHSPWLENHCTHAEDVGICCRGGMPTAFPDVRKAPSFFPRCPERSTADMRLVDCNRYVCRLEVKHEDKWGTVCDNGFTDTSAKTVCELIGYPSGKFRQMCSTQGIYGGCADNSKGTGPIWLDEVVCSGYERDLEGCRHRPWGDHKCTHTQDVGICCGGDKGNVFAPSKCRGGELYYKFNENLESSSGGPDLSAPWGSEFAGIEGVKFKEGQGLGVDPSGCIGPDVYSIYLRVKLDSTTNTRTLIHSNGWQESGLFVKEGKLTVLPEDTQLKCDDNIVPGKWFQYVITRAASGEIRVYLNGALCQHGTPEIPNFLKLNPDQLMFVADYGLRNPSGYINKVRIWDKVLSEDSVAKVCGCKLPGRDKTCERHIEMSPSTNGLKFSSVLAPEFEFCVMQKGADVRCFCNGVVRYGVPGRWFEREVNGVIDCSDGVFGDPAWGIQKYCECKVKNGRPGSGYSSGRLNSVMGWVAGSNSVGQWMQQDTGSVQSISGFITQGRRDADQWVTQMTISVSEDEKEWRSVQCDRIFDTNSDKNTKVKNWFHEPVHARYIRYYPVSWRGAIAMRAGVLVCERPCVGGKLNYQFPMSFISTTLGPALEPAWGEGEFKEESIGGKDIMAYNFAPGQGLQVDQGRCLKKAVAWTILIEVSLDQVVGYRRIIGSEDWGDYGLYVNNYLMLVPKNANMMCKEMIRVGKIYRFVMSRSAAGNVKLYINGEMCSQGKPPYKDNFQLSPDNVVFMRDDGGENAGGKLINIRIWDKELSDSDVEAVCQCTRPNIGESCQNQVIFNSPTARTFYSSIYNDGQKGVGLGRGRIGSQQCWSAKVNEIGQYVQLDSGKVQTISGVVTQGRRDYDQWVTSYVVHVSEDGADWRQVGCGTEFDANSDRTTKVKNLFNPPVKARYVRIYPQAWRGWLSMRAGLLMCEKPCQDSKLDYPFDMTFGSRSDGPSLDPAWGEGQFEDDGYRFESGQGLTLDASRCFQKFEAWTMIMRVSLDSVRDGRRVLMTSDKWDDDQNGLYVDNWLRLAPSGANMVCDSKVILPRTEYTFGMVREKSGRITLYIDGAACASGEPPFKDHYQLDPKDIRFFKDNAGHNTGGTVKSIRLWDTGMDETEVASKCGCMLPKRSKKECTLGYIPLTGTKMTTKYSSVLGDSPIGTGNAMGRLGSSGGWFPAKNDADQYMQIDTGKVQVIAGVVTQGERGGSGWVTFFKVKVSDDGYEWKDIRCQWIFQGNTDASTKVETMFNYPVEARFVRIIPTSWRSRIAMRAGVLICMMPCINGELKYRFDKGNLLSQTDGPAMDPAWGSGFFQGDDGYRFDAGKGFEVDQDVEGCMNNHKGYVTINGTMVSNTTIPEEDLNTAYTIFMSVKLTDTNGIRRLVGSKGWGDQGLYVKGSLELVGASMRCDEQIHPNMWYQIGMTRSAQGKVCLYINGHQCASASPMSVVTKGFQLDQDNVKFFHDDGDENSAGNVKEIMILNKAKTREQMAEMSGCKLSEEGEKCERQIVFNAQNVAMSYSTVTNNDKPGFGYARGRLNSMSCWQPMTKDSSQYMQIDSGEVRSIAGVVTQGRRDSNMYATAYTVQTSSDGISWAPVQCGEEFAGNTDQNTKIKTIFKRPVKARYVRIYPTSWVNWPAMRAGLLVCERQCVGGVLDYDFAGSFMSTTKGPNLDAPWGEGSWADLSQGYRFNAGQGLIVDESRCVNPSNFTVLVHARFDVTSGWRAIMSSDGWGDYGMYVDNQFKLFPSSSMLTCGERILPNTYYIFMMSRNVGGIVKLYLNGYMCSWGVPPYVSGFKPSATSLNFFHNDNGMQSGGYVKRIAIWDRVLTDGECAAESECKLADTSSPCNTTVTYIPAFSRFKNSGTWDNRNEISNCGNPRLGSAYGWCSNENTVSKWVEMDLGGVQKIAGVVTQGRGLADQYVSTYKVMVSSDGIRWADVQCGRVFDGNRDQDTKVSNVFERTVVGRYVRIFPQSWNNHMSMRVAALLCEMPCNMGQLDYQLLDDFESTTEGPELIPVLGYNSFGDKGYNFYNNRGLSLDPQHCMEGDASWTIYIDALYEQVHGYRRILNSKGWGDYGMYIDNGKLTMFPKSSEVTCAEVMVTERYYKIAITRSKAKKITLYLNGYQCAQGYPTAADGFELNPNEVSFFRDDGNEYVNGWVRRIRMWDRELPAEEIAEVSGCSLIPAAGKKCKETITFSPPYRFIKYSSVWQGAQVGVWGGRGRLNSPEAWFAQNNAVGEWFQMDLNKVQVVSGVATQGRHLVGQWVTSYKVSISDDGRIWRSVQCGMTFNGNADSETKVVNVFDTPVSARYVRIYPQTWNSHMSMRAGVMLCEQPCKKDMLDYRMKGEFLSSTDGPSLTQPWGVGYFTDNDGYRFEKGQGLSLNEKNCIGSEWTVRINARLDDTVPWGRIMTSEAWGDFGLMVKESEFLLFPRSANIRCSSAYIEPNRLYDFWLSRSSKGVVKLYINGFLCAEKNSALVDHFALAPDNIDFFHDPGSDNVAGFVKQITMWNKTLSDADVASISGCILVKEEAQCDREVVYNSPYQGLSTSSTLYYDRIGYRYGTPRLDSTYGWIASSQDLNQFLQFDLGKTRLVKGVVTQAMANNEGYVKAYMVEVSEDGENWQMVQCNSPFKANDRWGQDKVTAMFNLPVKAKYVKIRPTSWYGWLGMRAGLVLCEEPCQGGQLDFAFADSLLSSTDGPALDSPWGEGSFMDGGYRFGAGQGLLLKEGSCIKSPDVYTIIIDAKLDNVWNWNRLIASQSWGRYGVFVLQDKFRLYPDDLAMECYSKLFNSDVYKFGITRDVGGTVRLYLDGDMCAEGEPSDAPRGLALNKNSIDFFRDPSNLHSSGVVSRIRMWDKTLTQAEMATAMGCKKPEVSDNTCKSAIVLNVPYSQIRYSDVLSNDASGTGWGRGRLNSRAAWIAPYYGRNYWMQIDAGSIQGIAGVVTQGRYDGGWWVSDYSFKVSEDGRKWRKVECGRVFPGNKDQNTKVQTLFAKPLKARYVRIYPQTSVGYPSMRAGLLVCELECKGGKLDFNFDSEFTSTTAGPSLETPWGDGSFPGNELGYRFEKSQGLQLDEHNCIKDPKTWSMLLEARLDEVDKWRALVTAGAWGANGLFVGDNMLQTKPQDLACPEVIRSNYWYKFGFAREANGKVRLYINGYNCASGVMDSPNGGFKLDPTDIEFFRGGNKDDSAGYVRRIQIWNVGLTPNEMRAESGCVEPSQTGDCNGEVTMAVSSARDMRASSVWGNARMGESYGQGSLNDQYCWMSEGHLFGNKMEWLQVDTGEVQSIAGVTTKGCGHTNWFVRTYKIKVSEDGRKWNWVECGRIFDGNSEASVGVKAMFQRPVKARYVRFYPDTYYYYQAMRVGVIMCEANCKDNELDYKFQQSLMSSSGGPSLTPLKNEGTFSGGDGYRFAANNGLQLEHQHCFDQNSTYTILMDVRLDSTGGWKGLVTMPKWRDNGYYVGDGKYQLRPTTLACDEPIRPLVWYKLGLTRTQEGDVTLFINGYACANGKPTSNHGFTLDQVDMNLLEGPDGQSANGNIKRMQLWGKSVSDDEMADLSDCKLAPAATGACDGSVVLNPAYSRMRATTNWDGYKMGDHPYSYGRLHAQGAWIASTNNKDQWLQIDVLKVQNIAGLITQGRYQVWQWVTSYRVSVSDDALVWTWVECGRIFDANTNYDSMVKNTFDHPVKARYVRIHPETWYGHICMRAGLLICEGDCDDKHLDYNFEDSLASSTSGPSLLAEWGDGYYNSGLGYRIDSGKGLLLKQDKCIKTAEEYSILIEAKMDRTDSWRQIMGSSDWTDNGLYTHDSKYGLKPETVQCTEVIYADYFYKFGMSRAKDGTVKIYINGWPCAQGKPGVLDNFKLGKDLNFFQANTNEAPETTAAWITKLQVWGKTMSDADMASASSCSKPKEASQCRGIPQQAEVPYNRISFSSVTWGYGPGDGWGQVQLNADACWMSGGWDSNQWVQFDLGAVLTVNGVKVQGSGDWYNWHMGSSWVTGFKVAVSEDGSTWKWVECGKIFPGNTDRTTINKVTFDVSVKARYVRLNPWKWYNRPTMRAAIMVCESTCQAKMMDYEFNGGMDTPGGGPSIKTPWGFCHYYRQGEWNQPNGGYRNWNNRGLKITGEASCIQEPKTWSLLMNMMLDGVAETGKVPLMTSTDWGTAGFYIDDRTYALVPNADLRCVGTKIVAGLYYQYGITRDTEGTVTLYLNGQQCASAKTTLYDGFELKTQDLIFFRDSNGVGPLNWIDRLRIWDKVLTPTEMAAYSGCIPATTSSVTCDSIVANVPYVRMRMSSTAGNFAPGISTYAKGRINSDSSWWPAQAAGQWLQLDVEKVQTINGVVTQGRKNEWNWVTQYTVKVSNDGSTWKDVDCNKVFIGNTDFNTQVKNHFSKPVMGRYIRIYPVGWYNWPALRAAVLLCEEGCTDGHLDYKMGGMRSDSGGPVLTAPWGEGAFVPQVKDVDATYHHYDLAYHWVSQEECNRLCESLSSCVGYVVYSSGSPSCWLKYKMDTRYRYEAGGMTSYYNTKAPQYKTEVPVGYIFEQQEGLTLDPSRCINDFSAYTVMIEAMLMETSNWRKILSSDTWGDKGLYVNNGKLSLFPAASGIVCSGLIKTQINYIFTMTRNKDGKVKLYVNGFKCAEGSPTWANGYKLATNNINFFYDTNRNYNTAGVVRRIQLWNSTLTDQEIGAYSGCTVGKTAPNTCKKIVKYLPNVKQVDFSSSYNRDDVGQGYGSGFDLTGTGSWKPATDNRGEWFQVDLGKIRNITGIVTRGNYHYDWQITAYSVAVSLDNEVWTDVECGRVYQTPYKGYWERQRDDRKVTFDEMNEARFVRLYMNEFVNSPSMRMQVEYCDDPPPPVNTTETTTKKSGPQSLVESIATTLGLLHPEDEDEEARKLDEKRKLEFRKKNPGYYAAYLRPNPTVIAKAKSQQQRTEDTDVESAEGTKNVEHVQHVYHDSGDSDPLGVIRAQNEKFEKGLTAEDEMMASLPKPGDRMAVEAAESGHTSEGHQPAHGDGETGHLNEAGRNIASGRGVIRARGNERVGHKVMGSGDVTETSEAGADTLPPKEDRVRSGDQYVSVADIMHVLENREGDSERKGARENVVGNGEGSAVA